MTLGSERVDVEEEMYILQLTLVVIYIATTADAQGVHPGSKYLTNSFSD